MLSLVEAYSTGFCRMGGFNTRCTIYGQGILTRKLITWFLLGNSYRGADCKAFNGQLPSSEDKISLYLSCIAFLS